MNHRQSSALTGSPPRRQEGFTLIELLVVVGILAVLVAIIIPAISGAKRASRTAICSSNLRELGLHTNNFLIDNNGKMFACDWYSNVGYMWINQLVPYGNLDRERFCPEANSETWQVPTGYGNCSILNPQGVSSHDAWISWTPVTSPFSDGIIQPSDIAYWATQVPAKLKGAVPVGSYGINGWCYTTTFGIPRDTINKHWVWSAITNPARVPLYVDEPWVNSWPDSTDVPPADPAIFTDDSGMDRFCIARHRSSVNVVFVDGHVENVPLPKLWTLLWSPNTGGNVWPANPPYVPPASAY